MSGRYGHKMTKSCAKDQPITIDMIDTPYSSDKYINRFLRVGVYKMRLALVTGASRGIGAAIANKTVKTYGAVKF